MRSRSLLLVTAAIVFAASSITALAQSPTYKLGRTPNEQEAKSMSVAVGPDGKYLPAGSGTAAQGAPVYKLKCAVCHGADGTGGPASRLVGSMNDERPARTVWSWMYATSIWDHINRSMPLYRPQSLTYDEVYALTAYLLSANKIIKETDVMDATTLPKVVMPYRSHYVPPKPSWKPGQRNPDGYYP